MGLREAGSFQSAIENGGKNGARPCGLHGNRARPDLGPLEEVGSHDGNETVTQGITP